MQIKKQRREAAEAEAERRYPRGVDERRARETLKSKLQAAREEAKKIAEMLAASRVLLDKDSSEADMVKHAAPNTAPRLTQRRA